MKEDAFSPTIPWYKTRSGKIFTRILLAVFLLFLGFTGMVGYYTWQITKGKGGALEKKFAQGAFSTDATLAGNKNGKDVFTADEMRAVERKHNPTLGEASAPVTVIAFIDFECPYSQKAYADFADVTRSYESGVRFVFKHLPLTSIHQNALAAAEAASCAQDQGKFWEYYAQLFDNKILTDTAFTEYAATLNLNAKTFVACREKNTHQSDIEEDVADAVKLGVEGTPTYFVNGKKVAGVVPRDAWDTIILGALKK